LVNDSNVDWNQSLPEVRNFAEQHRLQRIALDQYGFSDVTVSVPNAFPWNCQTPTQENAGQWVALSAANSAGSAQLCLALAVPASGVGRREHLCRAPARADPSGRHRRRAAAALGLSHIWRFALRDTRLLLACDSKPRRPSPGRGMDANRIQ